MTIIVNQKKKVMEQYDDARGRSMNRSRSSSSSRRKESEMVLAMVENAKESSWQQNIENAVYATRRFTLGDAADKDRDEPDFVKKIRRRATAIYNDRNDSAIAAMHRERIRKQASSNF
eukprot:CAMPEP_0196817556 /NCGR_PEP_ID=MMETSP1362-20130617/61404_1 /TAXON_ID=163516 /ORGANISM="Leptocylindrus danicus, Strain CCMP1856" /LENGTH=117 /DNA_ID=CAMNT_0042195305 /DNA_START=245 /DNA_END=598 /DNA_ORIENTATION=+